MFNTARLFKINEQKEREHKMRMDIRIMQMLHQKLEGMDLIPQLAAKMEAGEKASVPFLSYQQGQSSSIGEPYTDIFGEKERPLPHFQTWVEDSPLRKRENYKSFGQNSLGSIAYLFDTTLEELDFPEMPLFFKHCPLDNYASTPLRKVFQTNRGAMFYLRHLLGTGLDVSCSYELLDSKACDYFNGQSEEPVEQKISIFKTTWSIIFTGRKYPNCQPLPTEPPAGFAKDSIISHAYRQLHLVEPKDEGLLFCWPRLLHPFWMRPRLTPEMVRYCEEGNDLTPQMLRYERDEKEVAELQDPGEAATGTETEPCPYDCGGVLGKRGFCRTCSKKPAGFLSYCQVEGDAHPITHYYAGEGHIYAGIDCEGCGAWSRWTLSN